jgi:hypothetical protein
MRDTITTAPPLDQSKYAKVYTTYGGAPLYKTDTADSPFAGGGSSNQLNDGGIGKPTRAFSTDTAWDFNSNTQTLTIEGWAKVANVGANGKTSLVRPIGAAGAGIDWYWIAFQYTGGIVRLNVDVQGLTAIDIGSGASVNTWFHYVLQFTGNTIWVAVNGTRLGSYAFGLLTSNDMALQMSGTTTGGNVAGAGLYSGPVRVTLGPNRYGLNASASYTVPTDFFPTS